MKKRLTAMLLACLLLAGCGGGDPAPAPTEPAAPGQQEATEPPSKAATEGQEQPTEPVVPEEPAELTAVRKLAEDRGALFAVAFLGYAQLPSFSDLGVYLEANGFGDRFPFLYDIPESRLVRQEGGEIYAVVPVAADVELTIHDYGMDAQTWEAVEGEELLRVSGGEPVLLMGNISDLIPNLLIKAQRGSAHAEMAPCISLMDGSLTLGEGACDFTAYDLLNPGFDPLPDGDFCGTWYGRHLHANGDELALTLTLEYDGSMEYRYGYPNADLIEKFSGSWYEREDGRLVLEMHGGPVTWDGSQSAGEPYDMTCVFDWNFEGSAFVLSHVEGNPLTWGGESDYYTFMYFDAYTLAGNWEAGTVGQGWIYELQLSESSYCRFSLHEGGEELVAYEGWWYTYDDVLSLTMYYLSGTHPENPELNFMSGEYRYTLHDANVLSVQFLEGSILTLDMEESTLEDFVLQP